LYGSTRANVNKSRTPHYLSLTTKSVYKLTNHLHGHQSPCAHFVERTDQTCKLNHSTSNVVFWRFFCTPQRIYCITKFPLLPPTKHVRGRQNYIQILTQIPYISSSYVLYSEPLCVPEFSWKSLKIYPVDNPRPGHLMFCPHPQTCQGRREQVNIVRQRKAYVVCALCFRGSDPQPHSVEKLGSKVSHFMWAVLPHLPLNFIFFPSATLSVNALETMTSHECTHNHMRIIMVPTEWKTCAPRIKATSLLMKATLYRR
jgi:hypothetical protein